MRLALSLALTLAVAVPAAQGAEVGGPRAFAFMALGDMPYKLPDDYARFDALIARINKAKPEFSIHVGDIKSGSTPCTDENFQKVKDQFATFEQPLVYAIGDNEWTDCHRERAGKFKPTERLTKVRQMFFDGKPLAKAAIAVERQAEVMPEMKATDGSGFVENARWVKNGVLFAAVHVPGSNNNFEPRDLDTVNEYFARNKANVAWLDAAFAKAKADNLSAMVIAWQADVWDIKQSEPAVPVASGFVDTIKAVERGARAFGKPVLVINGDNHIFLVTPFYGTDLKPVPNVTRLQVMGEAIVGAVRVVVDPDNVEAPFAFQPINEPPKAAN
ncbi:hypothetical protein C2U72_12845 [Prosthecomicrobium hirschii]|uniref:hypothetical protein n=1 Tax=Prosthecodimorpha hirschii TaxID=665126 RepID=UPI00112959A4|nr:hypothetical protein [Prosthecomicrobium hirschii]TPQ50561.1 hypothetical protein C2U72_12845 [Prosthecomicrobium hirschii]